MMVEREQKGEKNAVALCLCKTEYLSVLVQTMIIFTIPTSPEEEGLFFSVQWYSCWSSQAHEKTTFGQAEVQTLHSTSCSMVL